MLYIMAIFCSPLKFPLELICPNHVPTGTIMGPLWDHCGTTLVDGYSNVFYFQFHYLVEEKVVKTVPTWKWNLHHLPQQPIVITKFALPIQPFVE